MTDLKVIEDTGEDLVLTLDETLVEEEDTSSDDTITQPFDPTKIRVTTQTPTIDLLLSRIKENEIDLTPDFQRRPGIWTEHAQSRLIESIIIRIPLPAFYMDGTNEEMWQVVDGLQRLTTLRRFVLDKELRLRGLEYLKDIQGMTFDKLPRVYQRRILETQIVVYLIEPGTPEKAKFNIFRRINTGGLPLSAQEIRHALNPGPATRFLERLADSPEFIQATDSSIRNARMADRECVLRFLAFAMTSYAEYRSDSFDDFLTEAMKQLNSMDASDLRNLEARFLRAMTAAYDLFGNEAFRKPGIGSRRYPINKPLFEAWSINLDALDDKDLQTLTSRKVAVRARFRNLSDDSAFQEAISLSTGDRKKIITRFRSVADLIAEVLE